MEQMEQILQTEGKPNKLNRFNGFGGSGGGVESVESVESVEKVDIEVVRDLCRRSHHFLCTQILGYHDWDIVHDDLERFLNRPALKKLILIPRGHLKTSIVTKALSIRLMLNNPNVRILIANQVWDKAREMLHEIKGFLENKSVLPQLFGAFQTNRWNVDSIEIQQRTRSLSSPTISTAGVESEMTSTHFDVILLDDLMGLQNYRTKDQRDKVKAFYASVQSLLDPGGLLIVLGTRYHQDDIYGHIIEQESEFYDVCVRKVLERGKIIFPKKFQLKFDQKLKTWQRSPTFSRDFLDQLKKAQGKFYYAQYMNDPTDDEDQLFKQAYFQTWREQPQNLFVGMAVDLAISEERYSDYTGIVVGGQAPDRRIYVLDAVRGKWGQPADIIEQIFSLYKKWNCQVVGIETNGFQKILRYFMDEHMRRTRQWLNVQELKTSVQQKDKFRIQALEPYYKNKLVFHGRDMGTLEEELRHFPRGKHDDLADATGMLLEILSPGNDTQTPFQIPVGSFEWERQDAERTRRRGRHPLMFIND